MKSFLSYRLSLKAKFLSWIAKKLKKGSGTSLPGLSVEKRYLSALTDLSKGFETIYFISGTNGKTTTRSIINHILESNSVKVCTNLGGANLIRGIATSLLLNVTFTGGLKAKTAVFEVEEASLPILTKYIEPDFLILTNVFRDQLDAYGEIEKTVDYFRAALLNLKFPKKESIKKTNVKQKLPKTKLILNGEDGKLVSMVQEFETDFKSFGLENTDFHPRYETLSNLNPKKIDALATKIQSHNLTTSFNLELKGEGKFPVTFGLPGSYNIYNLLSAILALYPKFKDSIFPVLKEIKPVFGRGEVVQIADQKIYLFLIKNPAGFDQVTELLSQNFKEKINLAININDNTADGKDVSWLWDSSTEHFLENIKLKSVITGGTRAWDMLLRLQYAGLNVNHGEESNLAFTKINELLEKILSSKEDFVVLNNYTSLLEFRALLAQKTKLDDISDSGN